MRLATRTGRVGILGGTLDPIHCGHLDTALAARQALALDPVLIMPARMPPHRDQQPAASSFHRFAMAALAVSGHEALAVADDELCSDGPSYTALTLERFVARGVAPTSLFFITGADAFAEIETWYRYPAVLDLAHFVVVSRPGVPADSIRRRLPQMQHRFHEPSRTMPMTDGTRVFLLDAATPDVSSTEVKRRVRAGEPISGLVPAAVEAHIQRHRLYVEPSTADYCQ